MAVTVNVATAPDRVQVEIVDDGPGILADQRERVFDRFVRLDVSRERAGGARVVGVLPRNVHAPAGIRGEAER